MKNFNWPTNMQPNEQRWLMCIDLIKEDAKRVNRRMEKAWGGPPAMAGTREMQKKPNRYINKRLERLKQLAAEGYTKRQAAVIMDIRYTTFYAFIKNHGIQDIWEK